MPVKPIPEGFHTLTPHLVVKGAADCFEFYERAFGAEELARHETNGVFLHGLMRIGDSMVMLADENPQFGSFGPDQQRPSPVTLHLYVKDVDKLFAQATKAGAVTVMPPTDMFWGDRYAVVRDPYGHSWSIATHVADPSPEEMEKLAAEAMKGGGC